MTTNRAGDDVKADPQTERRESRSRIYETIITSSDEKYVPPDQECLSVSVVGADAYLIIGKVEDTHKGRTMTPIAQVSVPIRDLLAAVYAAADTELFVGEMRRVQ